MNNINFAIIGFGGIARTHAIGAYAANLQLSLPYIINLKSIVSRKPLTNKIPPYGENILEINEALSDKEIDFIDICTPNDSHKEIVLKALKYGKAIYCEKPLSSNYKDAVEMTQAVEESGVKNAVALMYRYMPAFTLLKEEIQKGSIGEIIDFKIKLYHKSYLDGNKKGGWRTEATSGGGALMDLGVHLIDAVHFTLGDIDNVSCTTRVYFKDRTSVDEIAECKFQLSNNIRGSLEVSRIFADNEQHAAYVIYGTKGSIILESNKPYGIEIYSYENNMTITKTKSDKSNLLEYYPSERGSLGFHQDCHMSSIVNVANMIAHNKAPELIPTFRDGLKAQRVLEAAYISARENRIILIKDIK